MSLNKPVVSAVAVTNIEKRGIPDHTKTNHKQTESLVLAFDKKLPRFFKRPKSKNKSDRKMEPQ